MNEQKIKLCEHCKTKHPAKHYIQCEGIYLLACADCSKELTDVPNEQAVEGDISRIGIYQMEDFLSVNK